MCGIAGIIGLRRVNTHAVKTMMDLMVHRGPDDSGIWTNDNGKIVFGHRRLAIIDLTNSGHQPMVSNDGNIVITYNGEIYNYVELANRLKSEGYEFRSDSDTEVLLAVYQCWGVDGFSELNGMFSFALYDSNTSHIICARDRFGEKPFLFAEIDNGFAFASEYKALLTLKDVSIDINNNRLLTFLEQPRIGLDNERNTVFAGIKQLLPGEILSLNLNNMKSKVTQYWKLERDQYSTSLSPEDAASHFRELLTDSVAIRMRSDVPVGSCLSGGLDSSTIVCLNRHHIGEDTPYHVFTGRFPESDCDEWTYAEEVIRQTGVISHQTEPKVQNLMDEFPKFIWHNELPVGSTSQYAQWCVFRLAKEYDVTVLMDGQGADEILGGYEQYFRAYLISLSNAGKRDRAIEEESRIRARYPDALADTIERWKMRLPFRLRRQLAYLSNKGSNFRYGLKGLQLKSMDANEDRSEKETLYEALYNDTFHAHLPTLLRYGDRNSMAHSREVRLPFCDYRLAEFTFSQPASYLMGNVQTKYLLRRAMDGILPNMILKRWNKQGFLPPQHSWFLGGLDKLAKEIINSITFRERGYWDVGWWQRVQKRLETGEPHLAWLLWKPVISESWHQHFVNVINGHKRQHAFQEAAE
ncbi:MAG: asparagine synthase (glutamine-hydrolyzing) [Magnetovibrio sp.]|nr:asparagine synthase (glutamine-hydrolyzing) [Magnetovibrio sp.]